MAPEQVRRVRQLIEKALEGKSKAELGRALGITGQSIGAILGTAKKLPVTPAVTTVQALARHLGYGDDYQSMLRGAPAPKTSVDRRWTTREDPPSEIYAVALVTTEAEIRQRLREHANATLALLDRLEEITPSKR